MEQLERLMGGRVLAVIDFQWMDFCGRYCTELSPPFIFHASLIIPELLISLFSLSCCIKCCVLLKETFQEKFQAD